MKRTVSALAMYALPALVFAQGAPQLGNIEQLVRSISRLIGLALPIVVSLALLAFFWGLAKFVFAAGDEVDKDKGKDIMIWGIVALFVMVSVWGLVQFVGNALGIQQGQTLNQIPTVQGLPQ